MTHRARILSCKHGSTDAYIVECADLKTEVGTRRLKLLQNYLVTVTGRVQGRKTRDQTKEKKHPIRKEVFGQPVATCVPQHVPHNRLMIHVHEADLYE